MSGRSDRDRLVRDAIRVLTEAGIASPEHDARALAAHVLEHADDAEFAVRLAAVVERRRRREPLQHITGRTGFRYLDLIVRPGVFVPRPETELVAGEAVDEARRVLESGGRPVVVDLCCGAGGIAVAVASEVPGSQVVAVDLEPAAVELTRDNAVACGVQLRVEGADATDPDVLAELAGRVDVVVANPPYIPPDAVPIDPEVRDHDPPLALYGGGPDGLAVPQGVLATAARLLRPGGLLVMEHGDAQGDAMRAMAGDAGLVDARTLPDLLGRDRMVVARRPVPPAAPS